jgi:hypothetical protein
MTAPAPGRSPRTLSEGLIIPAVNYVGKGADHGLGVVDGATCDPLLPANDMTVDKIWVWAGLRAVHVRPLGPDLISFLPRPN